MTRKMDKSRYTGLRPSPPLTKRPRHYGEPGDERTRGGGGKKIIIEKLPNAKVKENGAVKRRRDTPLSLVNAAKQEMRRRQSV